MRLEIPYPNLAATFFVRTFTAAVHGHIQPAERAVDGGQLLPARTPATFFRRADDRPWCMDERLRTGQVHLMHLSQEREEQIAAARRHSLREDRITVGIEK